jgi:catechol 2,3-dioxygenase-like lactoylglutathione lyase family enzyme
LRKAHLRVARPTNSLSEIIRFYRDGLGFEVIDSFEDHQGFDGVMLGHTDLSYHLEFTHQRAHKAPKASSKENLLVFYLPEEEEWRRAVDRMLRLGYESVKSYNPYWDVRGKTFEDADGYRVVLQATAWP